MQKKSLLLVGFGNMGSALLIPIHEQELFQLSILSPNSKPSFECNYYSSPKTLRESLQANAHNSSSPFNVIIFAVKPYQIKAVLEAFPKEAYDNSTTIISALAGVKLQMFQQILHGNPKIVRIMANLPVKQKKGVIAVFPPSPLPFLQPLGQVISCEYEEDIDKFTSIIGSGSGFCFHLFKAYQEATQKLGLPEGVDSKTLILNLFEGSIEMAKQSDNSFGQLKDQVVTPNGTTHAGLQHLQKTDIHFEKGLAAAFEKCSTLAD